jgi:hypothetical protein
MAFGSFQNTSDQLVAVGWRFELPKRGAFRAPVRAAARLRFHVHQQRKRPAVDHLALCNAGINRNALS